jgi:hypothetical protein
MNREQAKAMLPFITAFAEGHEIKYKGITSVQDIGLAIAGGASVDDFEIVPKKKPIDLSCLIESGIDCEFWDEDYGVGDSYIGKLSDISGGGYRRQAPHAEFHEQCRPRMNHVHFWGGGKCHLPQGLRIEVYYGSGNKQVYNTNASEVSWANVYGFKVIGLADGWEWPWESDQ